MNPGRNQEHYRDPTAVEAVARVRKVEKQKRREQRLTYQLREIQGFPAEELVAENPAANPPVGGLVFKDKPT